MQLEKEKETREAAERCRLLAQRIAEELAPEAAAVLAADEESGALLEKALGEATVTLRAERMGPDVLALLPGSVSGSAMVQAVCSPAGYSAEQLTVLADCTQMAELVHLAGNSVVPADAPAELRLAARQTTLTDHDAGAAAELLYGMVRSAETSA